MMKKEITLEKNGFCIVKTKEEADRLKTSDDFGIQGPSDKTENYYIVCDKRYIKDSLAKNILEVGHNYDFIFDNIDAVFLDTNVFCAANYTYKSDNFKNFIKAIRNNNINICITDVIEEEIYRRIDKDIDELDKDTIRFFEKAGFIEQKDKKELKQYLKKCFKDLEIEVIEANAKILDIVDLWKNKKNPFSPSKPSEFVDAINLLTINTKKDEKNIAFISNDGECQGFCKENQIIHFQYISNAAALINAIHDIKEIEDKIKEDKKNKFYKEIEEINKKYEIMDICKEQLSKYLEDKDEADYNNLFYFNINLYSGKFRIDYAEAKIDSLAIKNSMYIDITDDNRVSILFDIGLEISVDTGKYMHEPSSHGYDKEDNEYYCKEYKKTVFKVKEDLRDILFLVDYDQDKKTIGAPFPTHEIRIHGDIDDYEKDFTSDEFIYD
nr:MAG TPA: PIN domain [Caudoviricetes sp.]